MLESDCESDSTTSLSSMSTASAHASASMPNRKRHNDSLKEVESSFSVSKRIRRGNDFLRRIEDTVLGILARTTNDPPTRGDFMSLYSEVYQQIVAGSLRMKRKPSDALEFDGRKHGCTPDEIYRSLEKAIRRKLREVVEEGQEMLDLLSFYASKFGLYKLHVTFIDGMFSYMNRCWIRAVSHVSASTSETIYSFAMTHWRKLVFEEFRKQLATEFSQLLQNCREDLSKDQELIKAIADSYIAMSNTREAPTSAGGSINLDIYCENFEIHFLVHSKRHYARLASLWTNDKAVSTYLHDIESYLENEKRVCTALFHETTIPKVITVILNEFIREKSEFLLATIPSLIDANDTAALKTMFELFMRLEQYSMNPFIQVFKGDFIRRSLEAVETFHNAVVNKEIDGKIIPIQYVNTLVIVCHFYDRIISSSFNNHADFRKAFDEAAVIFVNQNVHTKLGEDQYNFNKTPELLGRFSHAVLVKNSLIPQEETASSIDKLFLLLKYTESKDSFEKYYNWNLLNRLINKTSSSEEHEGNVITKIKSNFGQDYSMKSYQLTQDARISDEISRNFKAAMEESENVQLQFDFHIIVFKNGSCKLPECPPINIPQQLAPVMNSFIEHYDKQYEGRTLTWYHNKSFGEVIYNAGQNFSKKYTFTVSMYQMTILFLFNERTTWTLEDMKESTLIEAKILSQVLSILERTKLLTKTSGGAYELFQNYKSNKHKHDINVPIKPDVKSGSEEAVNDEVQSQRNFLLQAVIVRLMKANQSMRHSDLIAQTIAAASNIFKPNVARIKRTIDCLIEKEYLQRHSEEADLYLYIS